jgi:hypothetical protein
MFSARGWSFLAAPDENWIWGRWTGNWYSGDELHLFPGIVAVALAVFAVIAKPSRTVWVYLGLLALMVELSLGFNGHVYPWLYRNVWALQGMRAAARASILAFCALAVLAAFGYLALERRLSTTRARRGLLAACVALLMIEYGSAPMVLTAVPAGVPQVYQFLRRLPRGVVIELPPASPRSVPGYDVVFMYSSLDHFFPLVNGYSGNVSRRYLDTLKRISGFPDDASVEHLRELDVRYLVVHENRYGEKAYLELLTRMTRRPEFALLGRYRDIYSEAAVFEMRPEQDPAGIAEK